MSDEFDRALDRLLENRSPRSEVTDLDEQEQRMLRMAQLLRGSSPEEVDPGFRSRLHDEVLEVARAPRVSRRTAFLSGLGALAAGVIGGLGLGRLNLSGAGHGAALIGDHGSWFAVADAAELQDGTVKPFAAGAVQGVLVRQGNRVHAMSRTCTHMGCALAYQARERNLVCPCHGAEFALNGRSIAGPGGYSSALPSLPALKIRTHGGRIEVWSVAETAREETPGKAESGW